MNRARYLTAMTASLVAASLLPGHAAGRFDQKLTSDQQIVHVLNRLTFGPRPGDVETVRRTGVAKWIDLQLHPDRIAEDPSLDAKLARLRTWPLQMWQILDQYGPPFIRPPSVS